MSAAAGRMREAAGLMRAEPDPLFAPIADWLERVALDATWRERHQDPATHRQYLALGERADARRVADAYLTAIHEGATP